MPVNLFNGADFFKKLSLIARVLPVFISTTSFPVGSSMIKHSGLYPKVAEPYSTLFFFLTIWPGVLVYSSTSGAKLLFADHLKDVSVYDAARSILAEFFSVSLWGNLGRIQSKYITFPAYIDLHLRDP